MGKSTAADILARLGLPVLDTDLVARDVVAPGTPALSEIRQTFGPEVLQPDGTLDRARLASVVFGQPALRTRLEGILHPRIRAVWQGQLEAWASAGHAAGAVVIPLLFETTVESRFDAVVCLACSATTQRRRLSARGWTDAQIDGRLAAQLPVAEKILRAAHVIWTEPPPAVHEDQWRCLLRRRGVLEPR